MRLSGSCTILWRPRNNPINQQLRWFFAAFSRGAYSLVTERTLLCITGAVERLLTDLSSQDATRLNRLSDRQCAQLVDQETHQRRVGVWRNAVAEVGDVATPRVKASQCSGKLAADGCLIGGEQQRIEIALQRHPGTNRRAGRRRESSRRARAACAWRVPRRAWRAQRPAPPRRLRRDAAR